MLYKLIIITIYLALIAIWYSGVSVLSSVVRFTLGTDLARFCFHSNPNYVKCACIKITYTEL